MVKKQDPDKVRYRAFCNENNLWLFIQPWWLDALIKSRWKVVLDIRGGRIMGGWVYCVSQKFGVPYLTNAPLSPYQGFFFNYPRDLSVKRRLSFEEEVLKNLVKKLPGMRYYSQKLHPRQKNLIPLLWKGFSVRIRYTYVLEKLNDLGVIWDNFYSSTRKSIRKAENRYSLRLVESHDPKVAYDFHEKSMNRKREPTQFSMNQLQRLDEELLNRNQRKILIAEDPSGVIHGAVYIVWNSDTAYYLLGGTDPDLRHSGASIYLIWEAIRLMSKKVDRFDFEGSMIPAVERIFRSFGAKQNQYFQVKKYRFPLNLLKIWQD